MGANARPHILRQTLQKISKLGYEIMPHLAYSPDIAPTDYHLLRSLYHHLKDQIFNTWDDVKKGNAAFISSKNQDFYKSGIGDLVRRWEIMIENDGDYVID